MEKLKEDDGALGVWSGGQVNFSYMLNAWSAWGAGVGETALPSQYLLLYWLN